MRALQLTGKSMPEDRGEVTVLLDALRGGRPEAESRLFTLVYGRLKQLARGYLRKERPDHSLHATDLVHEAYLRMAGAEGECRDRTHFFSVAAQAMRRILVDHARAHLAAKRGEGIRNVPLDDALFLSAAQSDHLLEIDEALKKLAAIDPRQARIVELRFFAGLSVEETAEIFNCSDRTIKREWRVAQAWLRRELSGGQDI
jgi:RNA polymerase sigma factor (TIGR02999 family)